jgi:hypothetical protein
MKWLKYIFLRIIYMTAFDAIVEDLRIRGYRPLTDGEKKLIISLLEIGENSQAVIHAAVRRRQRLALFAKLKELGINESDLTDDELSWIEELIGARGSISNAAAEIKKARAEKRHLADPRSISSI